MVMSVSSFYSIPNLSDGFGSRKNGRVRPHRGLDFPRAGGTAIPAVKAGVVTRSAWHDGLGWVVEVKHSDGYYTGYCHMLRRGIGVGTKVAAGGVVGYVGNTGNQSKGNHLHITLSKTSGAVYGMNFSQLKDPWPYINAARSAKPTGSLPANKTWAFNPPSASIQKRIQAALKKRKRYGGPIDGKWGKNSIKGLQITARNVGYTGPIDGDPGPKLVEALQKYARKFGGYKGPIDKVAGPKTWEGVAKGLEAND